MSYTTDFDTRGAFIANLFELAWYLASHSDVPVPERWHDVQITLHLTPGTEAEKHAQIDHIAQLLDAPTIDRTAECGFYQTERRFGNITYRAVAISAESMRRYEAGQSYADSVTPDTETADR